MKYRKRPVVIDAIRYYKDQVQHSAICTQMHLTDFAARPHIHTLEGPMTLEEGDWIIKGVKGEHYPCKPDIFEATYEAV